MGMWSVPWQNREKAGVFAERMREPWMAKVRFDEEEEVFFASLDDVGGMFWE